MPRLLTVASWNVEHFKDEPNRVGRIVDFIKGQNGGPSRIPDIFALYEVEGREVYDDFMEHFPDHRFYLTEGKQSQEIFLGIHKKHQCFVSQRLEYKTQREYQRPGLLATVKVGSRTISFLFLHVRSGTDPEDFGLRDAAIEQAFKLKKALDDRTDPEPAEFVFLGDLNTMGIDDPVPYSKVLDFESQEEIDRLADWSQRRDMKLVTKDAAVSWWNGSSSYDPTDLDHVVASEHMDIRGDGGGDVSVLGWPRLPDAEVKDWLEEYSDHGCVCFEVW